MWLHSVYVFPCCKFQISAIPAFRSPQHALYLLNSLALGHRDSTQVVRQCHCLSQSNQQLCLECRQLKFASLVQCSGPRFIEADRPCASLKLLSEQKLSFERTKNQIKADHFNFISLQKPWKLQYLPQMSYPVAECHFKELSMYSVARYCFCSLNMRFREILFIPLYYTGLIAPWVHR